MSAKVHNLPPLALRGDADSVNEADRTVRMTFSTGARVYRGGMFEDPFYEELSMDPKHVRMGRLSDGAPFLANHDGYDLRSVLGVVTSAQLDGQRGVATVRFAKAEDHPEADRIFRMIKDGILRNVSVGYRVHKFERDGDQDGKPVYRAVDWEPYEISAVPMGADARAQMRTATPETNSCEFLTRAEVPAMSDETKSSVPAPAAVAAPVVAAPAVDVAAERKAAAAAERTRVAELTKIAKLMGDKAELDKWINDEVSADTARGFFVDSTAQKEGSGMPRVEMGQTAQDKFQRGLLAAMLHRLPSSMQESIRTAQKKFPLHPHLKDIDWEPAEFRSVRRFADAAKLCLDRSKQSYTGLTERDMFGRALGIGNQQNSDELQSRAFGSPYDVRAGGFSSTSDFTVLLENVLYKILLGQYAITPDNWRKFCKVDSVVDFRPANRYRLGSLSVLDAKNEHGEFKHKAIPDGEKRSISATSYGNIIAVTRETLVNDDMGAMASLASMLGRAAGLSLEVATFALLAQNAGLGPTMTDGYTLFHANHFNIGSSGALSVTTLDADRVLMKKQKDPSLNEVLDLEPRTLLVPAELGMSARLHNTSVYDPDSTGGAGSANRPNGVAGLFSEIVDSARLSATSSSRRYLFADLNVAPALVMAFLEGQEAPLLEQKIGWNVDGVEWKCRLDYGVQAFDWRGAVTNAGT